MITGFRYAQSGACFEFREIHELGSMPQNGESLWVDLETPTPQEAEILSKVFNFHHLAIEDCWHEPQHPKADDYGDYLFMVVHGVRYDAETEEFTTHELNIFLGPNYLVTFHSFHSRSVEAAQNYVRRNPNIMARGMDFMLHQIVDRLIDNYFPKLEILEDKIEALETAVFTDPNPAVLNTIFDLRRHVVHLKRVASQEREVLIAITRGAFPFVNERSQIYFKDIYDHLFKIVEVADNHRETINIILQAYLSIVSNKLNDTMRVLTLIATIMLPLTVVTGIYGMNFDHMPELRWRYGYHATLGAMALLAGGMLFYFRRRKWL
jgi:magnesium transporter